jgi:hypothetical protein
MTMTDDDCKSGFRGDVVSNHSILIELESRGNLRVLTDREEQEKFDEALKVLFKSNVESLYSTIM